jgi:hypothetical protein
MVRRGQGHPKHFSRLRTYADFLDLDGELYVAELHTRLVASRPPPPPPPKRRLALPSLDLRAAAVGGTVATLVPAGVLACRFGAGPEERSLPDASPRPPAATTTVPAHKPRREENPALARLVMTGARGDCWLSVRAGSTDGSVLEGILREGDSLRFAASAFGVRMGAP